MKVVINTCFGGFDLSPEALLWMYERGCKEIAYPVEEYYGFEKNKDRKSQYEEDLKQWKEFVPSGKRSSLLLNVFSPDDKYCLISMDIRRDHPILIECVEAIGEKSFGACAELNVVEIPDGVEWEIDEYDGNETIDEVHRSWR